MSAIVPDQKTRLITAIRGWTHMDNIVENFTQQATNARKLRIKHEEDAIQIMKDMGIAGSTIQISGANLQIARRKSTTGLSWTYLEKEVAAWGTKHGITPMQTKSLIDWLQDHREVSVVEHLKKTVPVKADGHLTN